MTHEEPRDKRGKLDSDLKEDEDEEDGDKKEAKLYTYKLHLHD